MGIRKKMRRQFSFDFCPRKGHYDGKNFLWANLLWINVFNKQLISSVLKKMGSHGDHRGVLLACQGEKMSYHRLSHSSKYLSKPSE